MPPETKPVRISLKSVEKLHFQRSADALYFNQCMHFARNKLLKFNTPTLGVFAGKREKSVTPCIHPIIRSVHNRFQLK